MKYLFIAALIVCAACHKGSPAAQAFSGTYRESSPMTDSMTLDFVSSSKVTISGSRYFLEPITAPVTVNYTLSSDSVGKVISFLPSGSGDTLSFNYTIPGADSLTLTFPNCPAGVPCYSLGGAVFQFNK